MREIKFEYILKQEHGDKFQKRIFTIQDLEDFEMDTFLLECGLNIVTRRQYTGLKDKNGKEIFEGDILKWEGYVAQVVYRVTMGELYGPGFYLADEYDYAWGVMKRLSKKKRQQTYYEVIGNIYENPEFLKSSP